MLTTSAAGDCEAVGAERIRPKYRSSLFGAEPYYTKLADQRILSAGGRLQIEYIIRTLHPTISLFYGRC